MENQHGKVCIGKLWNPLSLKPKDTLILCIATFCGGTNNLVCSRFILRMTTKEARELGANLIDLSKFEGKR